MSLAIECGATHSSILYVGGCDDKPMKNLTILRMGPANYKLMGENEFERFLNGVKFSLGQLPVNELGIGAAGILSEADKKEAKKMIENVWPNLRCLWIGGDADTAISCLHSNGGIKIVVIGGTGSNCFGDDGALKIGIGGSGHILGDRGSCYAIALKAMQLGLREYQYDVSNDNLELKNDSLLYSVISWLQLQNVADLVSWSIKATKSEIAAVACKVIELFKSGNPTAREAVNTCIKELAEDCVHLIKTFLAGNKFQAVEIGVTGSLFVKNEEILKVFRKFVNSALVDPQVKIKFHVLRDTVKGALKNINIDKYWELENSLSAGTGLGSLCSNSGPTMEKSEAQLRETVLPVYNGLPQTECRNPKSMNLHTMTTVEAIDLMIMEESNIYREILKEKDNLVLLIERISFSLKNGGKLYYVGAGTSGRLGILDASECPPTFRTHPDLVQGIIAGGFSSVSKAKEGAEDSITDGMNAIKEKYVCQKDVVIGIAASGRTPFVWGALYQAQTLGAFTAFLTFNVRLSLTIKPDILLAMDLGPEILTGSTRLKSGSATKCILNMLSTIAMVKMGKCFENLMVDLNPANEKLRQRALRIVLLMTNAKENVALPILQNNKYDIKSTVIELRQILETNST